MKQKKILTVASALVLTASATLSGCAFLGGHTHDWGDWKVTKAPTCEEAGTEERVCKDDPSHTETRSVSATGHKWAEEWTIDQTKHYHVCENGCGKHGSEGGHDLQNGVCKTCGYEGNVSSLTYSEVTGGLAVTGWAADETDKKQLRVPATHDGRPVVALAEDCFSGDTEIESASLPASVREIGSGAFYDSSLKNFVGTGVTAVYTGAFEDCDLLETVCFGDLETLGGEENFSAKQNVLFVFERIGVLRSIEVGSGSPAYAAQDGVLYNKGMTELYLAPIGLKGKVRIPGTLKEIGLSAFEDCTALEEVEIADGVERIGRNAFLNCTALTSVSVPDSVKEIGDAFSGCELLQGERAGGAVYLGNWVWKAESDSVSSVSFRAGTKGIMGKAFLNCTALETAEIPQTVVYIGGSAFKGCRSLREIALPILGSGSAAAKKEEACFEWIFGLEGGASSFFGDAYGTKIPAALKTVTVTGDVTVPDKCFYKCAKVEEILFTGTVGSVGSLAFASMTALKSVTYPGGASAWGAISKAEDYNKNSTFTVK